VTVQGSAAQDPPDVLARVHDGLALVHAIARRLRNQLSWSLSAEELVAYGHEGLLLAARTFDPSRGVPFPSWATLRIRGAMIDGVRKMGMLPRALYRKLRAVEEADEAHEALLEEDAASPPTTPEAADACLREHLAGMATAMALGLVRKERHDPSEAFDGSPEDLFARAEIAHAVRTCMTALPEPERTLLERHYFQGLTLEEAARAVGLSKSWGSRIHARAIGCLTRELRRARILG
jgi:RNA polymerase sigma factor for flagellar operon FliA